MPKNTSKRPYYSKALRAELETMRVVWRANTRQHLTLRQLHALVELERTFVEPVNEPAWYKEYHWDRAELQALFDATHPRYSHIRACLHFAMKSNSCALGPITSPDGTVAKLDGTVIQPDGTIVRPDGSVAKPETEGQR